MATTPTDKIMVDDTKTVTSAPVADVRLEMAEIAKHAMYRNDHHAWVIRQLSVLVYDGPEDEPGQDEKPEATGGSTSSKVCSLCSRFPRFPQGKPVRHFRLVQPWTQAAWGQCSHVAAMSYCWGPYATAPRTSVILDDTEPTRNQAEDSKSQEKQTQRKLPDRRIPADAMLDRAVAFAAAYSLRFIWIDQACLPQDESDEHQLGIQAMDLLYNRAELTAGLLNNVIVRQHTVGAAGVVLHWWRRTAEFRHNIAKQISWWLSIAQHRSSNNESPGEAEEIASSAVKHLHSVRGDFSELIELISNDLYFTRAWVFQEALVASEKLVLQIQHEPGLRSFQDISLIRQTHDPAYIQNTISLRISDFREMNEAAEALFTEILPAIESYAVSISRSQRSSTSAPNDEGHERLQIALKTADRLFLRVTEPDVSLFYARGAGSLGRKYVCNASSAMALLRTRSCLYPEDKLAIVANCCNYDLRLDTFKLAKRFCSLRTCLLTLAMMNGDYSLLVSDLYDLSDVVSVTASPRHAYFIENAVDMMRLVDSEMISHGYGPRFAVAPLRSFTSSGYGLPAHIYEVQREIDMAPIKFRFMDDWNGMKSTTVRFYKIQGESQSQFAERQNEQRGRFEAAGRPSSTEPGIEVSRVITVDFVQRNPIVNTKIATIFFAILRYLKEIDEIALANSIWHSIRAISTRNHENVLTSDLPDDVCQALFDNATVKFNPWDAIRLLADPSSNSYQYLWIIEQIINHGTLWVGEWAPTMNFGVFDDTEMNERTTFPEKVPKTESSPGSGQTSSPASFELTDQFCYDSDDSEDMERYAIALSLENEQVDGQPGIERDENPDSSFYEQRGLMDRLGLNNFHAMIFSAYRDRPSETGAFYIDSQLDLGLYVFFELCDWKRGQKWDWKQENMHCKHRVAAFNVEGPCTVAVPYSHDLEIMPHSQVRGMKICWVVEKVNVDTLTEGKHRNLSSSDDGQELQRTKGERHLSYRDVQHRLMDAPNCTFRILETVNGAWEIIDPCPCQIHRFQ